MSKRILSMLLCVSLFLSVINIAAAAEGDTSSEVDENIVKTISEGDVSDGDAEGDSSSENDNNKKENEAAGLTGTIGSGVYVYAAADETSESYHLWAISGLLSYSITIEEQITDEEGNIWYRYSCEDLLASVFKNKYPYVKASDVILDDDDEKECTCGTADGSHAKDCPLYQTTESDSDEKIIVYTGQGSNLKVEVYAAEEAFQEDIRISVSDASVDSKVITDCITAQSQDMEVLGFYAVDISFYADGVEQQPAKDVTLKLVIPDEAVPENANMAVLLHMGSNGTEVVETSYLQTSAQTQYITARVSSFSTYAVVLVNNKYNSRLLSDVLKADTQYEIVTFKADLFDYDPVAFNDKQEAYSESSDQEFYFNGYGDGHTSMNGINNSASAYAKQGIVGNSLVDGVPAFQYVTDYQTNPSRTGKALFDDNTQYDGKTIYKDVDFQFVYDNETGYYEYKSSANHAQYNVSNKTIELYADTLSMKNAKTVIASPISAKILKYVNITDTSNGVLSATSTGTDPHIGFDGLAIDASKVTKIYIKAWIGVTGSNMFQLFFKGDEENYTEAKSFRVSYSTSESGWVEFMIDTTANQNWNGTIKSLRIDPFNTTGDFKISEISSIENKGDYAYYGGFYPFSDITKSYPGNSDAFSLDNWKSTLNEDTIATQTASRAIGNSEPENQNANLAFGAVLEFDFYLPVDRAGDDLTYYFNGDDDLWVFVDNQLVLDIGGGHGAISGTVNFTKGTTEVANAVSVSGYDQMGSTPAKATGTLSSELMTVGKHTMKIFYMERCGSVSNCYMKFNLPQTPEAGVTVGKEAVVTNEGMTAEQLKDLYHKDFTFKIDVTNLNQTSGEKDPDTLKYTLYGAGVDGTVSKSVDNHSTFTLKHGQFAKFDIAENHQVTVNEVTDGLKNDFTLPEYIYQSTTNTVTVGGTPADCLTHTTVADTAIVYQFVNTYEKLVDLTIMKTVIDSTDASKNPDQDFVFKISGNGMQEMTVMIPASSFTDGTASVTIKNLRKGTYTITEDTTWSWRYDITTSNPQTVVLQTNQTVNFENKRTEIQWLDGEAWCRNIFNATEEGNGIVEGTKVVNQVSSDNTSGNTN